MVRGIEWEAEDAFLPKSDLPIVNSAETEALMEEQIKFEQEHPDDEFDGYDTLEDLLDAHFAQEIEEEAGLKEITEIFEPDPLATLEEKVHQD